MLTLEDSKNCQKILYLHKIFSSNFKIFSTKFLINFVVLDVFKASDYRVCKPQQLYCYVYDEMKQDVKVIGNTLSSYCLSVWLFCIFINNYGDSKLSFLSYLRRNFVILKSNRLVQISSKLVSVVLFLQIEKILKLAASNFFSVAWACVRQGVIIKKSELLNVDI